MHHLIISAHGSVISEMVVKHGNVEAYGGTANIRSESGNITCHQNVVGETRSHSGNVTVKGTAVGGAKSVYGNVKVGRSSSYYDNP